MFALMVIFALLLIAAATPLWGADTRDGIDSTAYERRRAWRGRW